ncbi:MAG: DUF72 domain-containing protein [Gemmatimonadales bacterium]
MAQDNAQLGLFSSAETAGASSAVGPAPVSPELERIARRLPGGLRLGTSSWSFPGWHSIVYDRLTSEDTLARDGLAAYAAHPLLRTVSVDRSFYRPLDSSQWRAYAAVVPEDFRFVVKAHRALTAPLDPEAGSSCAPNPRFLDAAYASAEVVRPLREGLGSKLGVLVFQFPPIAPNLVGGKETFLDRLGGFLASLPKTSLYAIELRTPAFLGERYAGILEHTGAAHCYNVHPAMAPLSRQLAAVRAYQQPALVVRWMLGHHQEYLAAKERYHPFDRLVDEDPETRELVARAALDASLAERDAYVVANNKAEGSAPLTLFRLAERIAGWRP